MALDIGCPYSAHDEAPLPSSGKERRERGRAQTASRHSNLRIWRRLGGDTRLSRSHTQCAYDARGPSLWSPRSSGLGVRAWKRSTVAERTRCASQLGSTRRRRSDTGMTEPAPQPQSEPASRAVTIRCVVEIPKGSRNKYEYDHARRRDGPRPLSVVVGRVPDRLRVHPGDAVARRDPLDVLICVSEPSFPGCIVFARPVALLEMGTSAASTAVLCVPVADPSWNQLERLACPPNCALRSAISSPRTRTSIPIGGQLCRVGVIATGAGRDAQSRRRYEADVSHGHPVDHAAGGSSPG